MPRFPYHLGGPASVRYEHAVKKANADGVTVEPRRPGETYDDATMRIGQAWERAKNPPEAFNEEGFLRPSAW